MMLLENAWPSVKSLLACRGGGPAEEYGARAAAAEVSGRQLREELTFPADWGPTDWVRAPSHAPE